MKAQDKPVEGPGASIGEIKMLLPEKENEILASKRVARSAKKNVTAQDFVGSYVWRGMNSLNGIYDPNGGCLSITINPDVSGQVLISGFADGATLTGYVANDRLYIPNQKVRHNDYYDEDLWFWNVSMRYGDSAAGEDENSYYFNYTPSTPFFFVLTENDYLYAGLSDNIDSDKLSGYEYTDEELEDLACTPALIRYNNFESFWWLCQWITGTPLEKYFVFDETQWENIGDARFKDAWLPLYWNNGKTPEYEVPVYRNTTNPNQFILMDPYGPVTPYGKEGYINNNGKKGFIGFDITYPEFVLFYPFLYSCTENTGRDYYMLGRAGFNYFLGGYSIDDMKEMTYLFPSTLTKTTGVINITDALFAYIDSDIMISRRIWSNYDMNGHIILPSNYDAAVGDILVDENDKPIEYYNLQGLKVENPEKGSLVIKRQGSKVSKMIVP